MNRISILALLSFCCWMVNVSSAQTNKFINISGNLADSISQEALVSATVVLMQPADSVMASFNITNTDGKFILRRVSPGDYWLQITYIGYEPINRTLVVAGDQKDMTLGTILMHPATEMLDGATITDERIAVRVKKDTIIYNADAFKTQPNDVVEDLLKKMPGIEVESDGTITAEGEEVEKIYVDGKEFFGSDPKVATKNLPARAIKEVQVFDKKSEMAQFSGIDDGIRSKTINLKLKDEFKKGAFGSITGGIGTEERYNGKFNINSFNKKTQLSSLGQINNINEQGFSFNEYINFMGGMSNLMRNGRVRINSATSAIPISGGLSNGDTRTAGAGFNLNHELSKKTQVSGTYFYSNLDNLIEEDRNRNFFQDRGSFDVQEFESTDTKNQSHRISGRIDHEIDSTQTLKFTTAYSYNDIAYESVLNSRSFNGNTLKLQNTSDVTNQAEGQNHSFDANLTYRKKFKKNGRSVTSTLSYALSPSDQGADLESENTFYNRDSTSLQSFSQVQDEELREQEVEWSTTWTEPLGGRKYLGLTYAYTRADNDADKEVFDVDPDGNETINAELSNAFDQLTTYHLGEVGFRWLFDKTNVNAKIGIQRSALSGDIVGQTVPIESDFTHVLPSLSWNYDFSRTKSISLNYSTNITQPTLRQLQPIVDNSDPLNIYMGNPNLKPEYRHNVRLRFRNFSQFSNTSLFGHINLNITENQIANSTTIDERFTRTITPVNIDNNLRASMWTSFSAPLRFIDSKIRLAIDGSFNDGQTFINGEANETERFTSGFNISIENKKKELIDWAFGFEYSNSKTSYSSGNLVNQTFNNQTYWAEITKDIGTWSVGTDFNMTVYEDNASDANQTLPIWTAYVSKLLFNQKIEVKLSAFDILDRNIGYSQNADLNYIEEVRSNSIGQYFMATVVYTIGTFKNNAFQITGPRRRR